ncbi:hypothetical protein HYH03_003949 [Edaphochlamys debaryana]|uniref:phytol kinase n=1 Tax=Edaphochlamys debaryana TaxID=47281 RepID=A0A835Y8E9_9CHLO|nr:hypothetical protein HYH03_003949 [Edaphochlamys debaryana]|eukprot:KAG2498195.1 hypothetical protein HYH03_003949 [Edaphochlamys debaryana]
MAQGLLRTQAIPAAARQLANLADALRNSTGAPSRAFCEAALLLLEPALDMQTNLLLFDKRRSKLGTSVEIGAAVVEAVEETGLLEHAARLLLHLRRACPTGCALDKRLGAGDWSFAGAYVQIARHPIDSRDGRATAALWGVLSGPCARHAAMVVGLMALAEVEGGREEGASNAGASAGGGSPPCPCLVRRARYDDIGEGSLMPRLRALIAALDPKLPAPPHRPTALRLLLRVGFAALASRDGAQAAAASGGADAGGADAGGSRDTAPPPQGAGATAARSKAWVAFEAFTALTRHLKAVDTPWRGAVLGAAADTWRLAAAVLRPTVLGRGYQDLHLNMYDGLQQLLDACVPSSDRLTFPAEPPPAVAAALVGGALPLQERLLRRAGEAPGGLESCVLGAYADEIGWVAAAPLITASADLSRTWGCLLPLLAYGEPLQVAAFVASAAKLLRRTEVYGQGGRVGPALVCELLKPLTAPFSTEDVAPAGPVRARLGLVLSVGLGEWVAGLWRVVGVADAGTGPGGEVTDADTRDSCLATLLGLCRSALLSGAGGASAASAALAGGSAAAGKGTGGSSSGAGSGSGGPDGAGGSSGDGAPWPPAGLAAVEVEAVGLALRRLHARTPAAGPEPFGLIAETGLAAVRLAASRPQEVRALGASGSANAWQPAAVRAVAEAVGRGLGTREGGALQADTVAALGRQLRAVAGQLEAWRAGEEGEGGGVDPDPEVWAGLQAVVEDSTLGAALAGQLVPPAEARRRLGLPPACSHPACANLAGDSEAGLRLRQCGRCGQAGYCCRECQTAHWRGGHKQACGGGSGGGGSKAS